MTRSARTVIFAAVGLIAGDLLIPFAGQAASPPAAGVIAVNVRGMGQRVPSDQPQRFVRTVDLYSMTGERIGTATRDFEFLAAGTGDDLMTFHFADGDLVSRAMLRYAPSPSDPGHGRVRMSGWHDGREFPERAGFDDFFVIELDPGT